MRKGGERGERGEHIIPHAHGEKRVKEDQRGQVEYFRKRRKVFFRRLIPMYQTGLIVPQPMEVCTSSTTIYSPSSMQTKIHRC